MGGVVYDVGLLYELVDAICELKYQRLRVLELLEVGNGETYSAMGDKVNRGFGHDVTFRREVGSSSGEEPRLIGTVKLD